MDIKAYLKDNFEKLHPTLMFHAIKLTYDEFLAKDLVMEVYKKLIEREDAIPPGVNIVAYIKTAIKNQHLDNLRKRHREDPLEGDGEGIPSPQPPFDGSTIIELIKHLESLGDNCKNVLSLYGFGHSYSEIAEIEDISTGTVMSRMARCRAKLSLLYPER